eukprot:UN4479
MWRNGFQSYLLDAVPCNDHPTTKVEVQSKPSHQDTTHANEEPATLTLVLEKKCAPTQHGTIIHRRGTEMPDEALNCSTRYSFPLLEICPGGTHTCHGIQITSTTSECRNNMQTVHTPSNSVAGDPSMLECHERAINTFLMLSACQATSGHWAVWPLRESQSMCFLFMCLLPKS